MRVGPLCVIGAVLAAAVGCSDSPGSTGAIVVVGPEGGQFELDGVRLSIPPRALAGSVELRLTVGDLGAPELAERVRVSRVYRLLPEETRFLVPVRVTVPYAAELIPPETPGSALDVRRTDYTRGIERLGAGRVDDASSRASGECLSLGAFWVTAPAGPRPATVVVAPLETPTKVGQPVQFTAEVSDQYGRPMSAPISWSASEPAIARLAEDGTASPLSPGTTEVFAQAGLVKGRALLRVASGTPHATVFSWENPRPQGNPLFAVRATPTELWAAGSKGALQQRGTAGWTQVPTVPQATWRDLHVGVDGTLFLAGERDTSGLLAIWNGGLVTSLQVPDTPLRSLWTDGVMGIAAGAGPNLALLAPGEWRVAPSPVIESILCVGTMDGRVVVAGTRGAVHQLGDQGWQGLYPGPHSQLLHDCVALEGRLVALSGSALLEFEPGGWTERFLPDGFTATGLGRAGAALLVAGSTAEGPELLVEGAEGWVHHASSEALSGAWGRSADELYALSGARVLRVHPDGVEDLTEGTPASLTDLEVLDGGRLVALGGLCANAKCTSQTTQLFERDSDGRLNPLATQVTSVQDLAVSGPDLYLAAGSGVWRRSGGEWTQLAHPADVSRWTYSVAVCGGRVLAGGSGRLLKSDGQALEEIYKGGYSVLRSIACAGPETSFAVGDYLVLRASAGEVLVLDPTEAGFRSARWTTVWATPDGKAFIGGEARYILRWTGARFEVDDQPAGLSVARVDSIWGTGLGDIWAAGALVGGKGFLVHHDGARWAKVELPTERVVTSVTGLPTGEVWLGGESGTLLRGTRAP